MSPRDQELIDRANFESWLFKKTRNMELLIREGDKYYDELTERTWQQFKQFKTFK